MSFLILAETDDADMYVNQYECNEQGDVKRQLVTNIDEATVFNRVVDFYQIKDELEDLEWNIVVKMTSVHKIETLVEELSKL